MQQGKIETSILKQKFSDMKKLLIAIMMLPVVGYGQMKYDAPKVYLGNGIYIRNEHPKSLASDTTIPLYSSHTVTLIGDGGLKHLVRLNSYMPISWYSNGTPKEPVDKTMEFRTDSSRVVVYYKGYIQVDSVKQYWNGKLIEQ